MAMLREPRDPPDWGLPYTGHWTEMLALEREGWERMHSSIQEIERSCKSSHAKRHVAECDVCHGLVVDAVRARYLDEARSSKEWFHGRENFLEVLDNILVRVRECKDTLAPMWDYVQQEHDNFCRKELGRRPAFHQVALNAATGDRFECLLRRERHPFSPSDLGRIVREGMICPRLGTAEGTRLASEVLKLRLSVSPSSTNQKDASNEIRERIIGLFFDGEALEQQPQPTSNNNDNGNNGNNDAASLSLNDASWLRGPEAAGLDFLDLGELAERVARHHGAPEPRALLGRAALLEDAQRTQRRERILAKINTVKRAQAAHKKRLAGELERRARWEQGRTLREVTCGVCGRQRHPKEARAASGGGGHNDDILACLLCQVAVVVWKQPKQEAWCSEECMAKGWGPHMDNNHVCDAGSNCLLRNAMDGDPFLEEEPVLCLECVKSPTAVPNVFCTKTCAASNVVAHYGIHHPQELKKLAWEEGKTIQDVDKYVMSGEEVHKEKVAPVIDEKDLRYTDNS